MEDNRFHYPQNTRPPRPKIGTQRVDQFPPHPSVRLPPNVSRSPSNKMPAGVGVAPRPAKKTQNQQPSLHNPPAKPLNGHIVQNFKFPQVPPPIPESSKRDLAPPSSRGRYNMHDSYVSSVGDDSVTPRTTPSGKSGRFPTPPRDSSVYPESEYPDSPQPAYPSSRIMPPSEFPTPGQSRGADSEEDYPQRPPLISTTNLFPATRPKLGEISPASSRTTAMNALTAAIAAGFSSHQQPSPAASTPPARTFSPMRMPFEASASRPRTPDATEDIEPPQLRNAPSSLPLQTPNSALSAGSANPLLGLGINNPGMSSKVPVNKRPPKLDIHAVRDMEARGSTTSLTDLIRRATKLASNLDRGKTASRLGMLDMFGSTDKLGQLAPGKRDSTMSDLMSAFPAPAAGGTPRRDTMWPLGEKGYLVDEREVSSTPQKRKRKCCGLSLPVFIPILIIVVVLIAAAVLLPIFLILVPRQQKSQFDFSTCSTAYPCDNGGTSIVSDNACQCVCSNGFVGAHCEMLGSRADCTTMTLSDGSNEYSNATMGVSIMPIFADSQSQFGIALNASAILSLFSLNSLSCVSENQLVDFNGTSTEAEAKAKRFIMLSDFAYQSAPTPIPTAIPILHRQNTDSANGIVFAASTEGPSAPSPTDSPSVSTVTSISDTATPTSSATFAPLDISETQLSFARVVVLYVLERSSAISVAVNAQQSIQSFFAAGGTPDSEGKETVEVGFGELQLTADFEAFDIQDGSGESVGGK